MLTILTIPKPFKGQIAVTQRNALKSWTRLAPSVEVIVFGNEEGTTQVCGELGLRHEPHIAVNEFGTPLLNDAFDRAQSIARHDWLCYANCDIVLMGDFTRAFERLNAWRDRFMMVGERWDMDVTEALDFDAPDWEARFLQQVSAKGKQRPPDAIDYFVFKRGQCADLPAFAVGRPCWDHWLIWWMRHNHLPVVDASRMVKAVHQNHDYSHLPEGPQSVCKGLEVSRNRALAGSWRHLNTLVDATYVLDAACVRRTYRHWGVQFQRELTHLRNRLMVATGAWRNRLGLRKENLARMLGLPRH